MGNSFHKLRIVRKQFKCTRFINVILLQICMFLMKKCVQQPTPIQTHFNGSWDEVSLNLPYRAATFFCMMNPGLEVSFTEKHIQLVVRKGNVCRKEIAFLGTPVYLSLSDTNEIKKCYGLKLGGTP